MKVIDVTGRRFGKLIVVSRSDRKTSAGALWECKCDCGGETTTTSLKLRIGHTTSCGCVRRETIIKLSTTHGMSNKNRTYRTWKEMRQRCSNQNRENSKWYSKKGIKVCQRWDNFVSFLEDMGERPIGMTIDRINPDGDYDKKNCRWATLKQQAETNRGLFKAGMTPWNKGVATK